MFHVLLVFPVLIMAFIMLGVIISALLFGLFTFIASIIGGAWVSSFLKDKQAKKMVFVGFSTLAFIGLLPIVSVIAAFLGASANYVIAITGIMIALVGILSFTGIKLSRQIRNKYGKIALSACFLIALVLSVFLEILALITLL